MLLKVEVGLLGNFNAVFSVQELHHASIAVSDCGIVSQHETLQMLDKASVEMSGKAA